VVNLFESTFADGRRRHLLRWYFRGDRNIAEQGDQEDYESDPNASDAALDLEDSDASDFLPEFRWARLEGEMPWFTFRRSLIPRYSIHWSLQLLLQS
jgi:hypothetical protein